MQHLCFSKHFLRYFSDKVYIETYLENIGLNKDEQELQSILLFHYYLFFNSMFFKYI